MSGKAVFLYGLPQQRGGLLSDPALSDKVTVADQYDLAPALLARHRAVILSMHNDQRFLARNGALLEGFVADGGTLVIQGQVALPYLSFLRCYVPLKRPPIRDLVIRTVRPHPIFAGIDLAALNNRRGVRGFYGRGHNPPPPGAVVYQEIADAVPLDWQWSLGQGRVLMHSGNDMWTSFEDKAQNMQLARQLIDWCVDAREAVA